MPRYQNKYIKQIEEYVNKNTPIIFYINDSKYNEISSKLEKTDKINDDNIEIIIACYTLLYTTIYYHQNIKKDLPLKSYYILVGDYISSYILELLYKNNLTEIQQIFILNTKKILIDLLEKTKTDNLLTEIIDYYKG